MHIIVLNNISSGYKESYMNKTKNKPLYKLIEEKIKEDFKELPYYSNLPGERELCIKYDVSRPTIISALNLLEEEGLIIRKERKGAFYLGNSPYTDHQLTSIVGFFNDAKMQGKKVTNKILSQNIEKADKKIAKKLNINISDEIFILKRLRYIDGSLFSLSTSYIPIKYTEYLLHEDFTQKSLYDILSSKGIIPYKACQKVFIKPSDKYEALYLKIEEKTPICVLKSTTFTKENELIEYVEVKSEAYKTEYEMVVYNN